MNGAAVEASTAMEIVIGVDPGRDKCGVAVAADERGTLTREVVARSSAASRVLDLIGQHSAHIVVVGNRTGSRELISEIQRACEAEFGSTVEVIPVDEHMTSQEARARYWRETPRRGWRRLVPATMLVPGNPIDDIVAEILALRYFKSQSKPR